MRKICDNCGTANYVSEDTVMIFPERYCTNCGVRLTFGLKKVKA